MVSVFKSILKFWVLLKCNGKCIEEYIKIFSIVIIALLSVKGECVNNNGNCVQECFKIVKVSVYNCLLTLSSQCVKLAIVI